MAPAAADFWQFATRVYAQPEVATTCLWLQDHRDADVMVALFCLWAGHRAGKLTDADLAQLCRDVDAWRKSLIQPLRAARRWLKQQPYPQLRDGAETLRDTLKDSELRAEALQAQLLEQCLTRLNPSPATVGDGAAAANLRSYFTALGIAAGDEQARLAALCAGARAVLSPF